MGNNSININTTNDHLSPKTILKYKKTTYTIVALEFNVLACDRHTECGELNRLMRLCIIAVNNNKSYHSYNSAVISICARKCIFNVENICHFKLTLYPIS